MARANKKTKAAKRTSETRASESKVTVDRGESTKATTKQSDSNFLDRIQNDLEKNQSYLNLILGALIVIVLGVLIFNYFNKPSTDTGNVTPTAETTTDESGDVKKENLPGKYKVKEGDTLFTIAQKYYDDGGKYGDIMRENGLTSENIETGQELNIPKLESASPSPDASASPEASTSPEMSPTTSPSQSPKAAEEPISMASPSPMAMTMDDAGKGGATNETIWGQTISGDSYTVQDGDWLSKIAGRSYGDISKYEAIAKANNISNPDTIEVGTVLKIPRN